MMLLDVPFKGQRDYLQGPDLFDAVQVELQRQDMLQGQRMVVAFRSFARRACGLEMGEVGAVPARPPQAVASVQVGEAAGRRLGWIVETDQPVTSRVPFPEEEIVAVSNLNGQSIRLERRVPFRPAEIAVALTKHLHKTLFPAPGKRWIVSKIDMFRPLPDAGGGGMTIELLQSASMALTRSRVTCGDAVGDLFFSQVAE